MSRQMEQSEYWRGALIMGLGGGIFVFAALHLMQLFAWIVSGRILTTGWPIFSMFFAMLLMFLVSRWVLRSFFRWSKQRAARATRARCCGRAWRSNWCRRVRWCTTT